MAASGTYSAFTATTTNSGNSFAAGTVEITDASGLGTALVSASNQGPGTSTVKCIQIKYLGSLTSTVHFSIPSTTNGDKFQVQVERGSGMSDLSTRGSCTGFSATNTAFATADLNTFGTNWATGALGKATDGAWGHGPARRRSRGASGRGARGRTGSSSRGGRAPWCSTCSSCTARGA